MLAAVRHAIVGFSMGVADLVPGVSGGTIAFVSGRYERLVNAIRSIDGAAVGHLLRGRWAALGRHLDLSFLAPLLLGIAVAVLSLSGPLDGWLNDAADRPRLFAFFVGLVLASALAIARRLSWSPARVGAAAAGAAAGVAIALSSPARTPESAGWAVLAGALAISAMILPGISGSFVLLLAGQYERAITAISDRDLGTIAFFAVGAIVGLLLFIRVLRWTLARYHDPTVAILVGFIIGSVPRLWPWTACIECEEFQPVAAPTGGVLVALGLAAAGAITILAFERWATKRQ